LARSTSTERFFQLSKQGWHTEKKQSKNSDITSTIGERKRKTLQTAVNNQQTKQADPLRTLSFYTLE